MGKMGASGQANPKNDRIIAIIGAVVAITVAVIGCVNAVAVAGIDPFASWLMSRTPVATDTASPVPVIVTDTPLPPVVVPTEVYAPGVPAAGEDWKGDCIQSQQWKIYPTVTAEVDGQGCYQQPVWQSMYTRDGGLSIFAQPKALVSSEEYGFFTRLPQKGRVSVVLDLDKIDNGQVWFGVFSGAGVHDTDGVLLVAPPGDSKSHAFALKDISKNNTEKDIVVSKIYNSSTGTYRLGFDLQYGSITAIVEDATLTPIPFTSVERWLFVGYRAKLSVSNGTADIQALFSNLVIQ
jgi:hypothetical protein